MKNAKDVLDNAKNKSLKKGILVKYKGNIIKLDPIKVSTVAAFGLTSCLVISGVTSSLAPKIQTTLIEFNELYKEEKRHDELIKAYNNFEKSIIDSIQIPVNPITKRHNTNEFFMNLAQSVTDNKDLGNLFLNAYIKKYGYNSKEIQGIIDKISIIENTQYNNIEYYLNSRGFKDYESLQKFCLEYFDKNMFQNSSLNEEKKLENQNKKIDYVLLANDILNGNELKLYTFVQKYGQSSEELTELLNHMAFIEDQKYQTLKEYLIIKGFNSLEEWQNYCRNILFQNDGRKI